MVRRAFISNAPCDEDRALCEQLLKQLSPLQRKGFLSVWHQGEFKGGDDHVAIRANALAQAQVFVALLSPDYLSRDDCHEELRQAMERARSGQIKVALVLLRPCPWKSVVGRRARPLPQIGGKAKPASTWRHLDAAMEQVVQQLRAQVRPVPRWRLVAIAAASLLALLVMSVWCYTRVLDPALPELASSDRADLSMHLSQDLLVVQPLKVLLPTMEPSKAMTTVPTPTKQVTTPQRAQTGLANCNDTVCTLDVPLERLGLSTKVCLYSSQQATISGRPPVCTLHKGQGQARCTRSDANDPIELAQPVKWAACTP